MSAGSFSGQARRIRDFLMLYRISLKPRRISVTRRYIDFLFTREEPVMTTRAAVRDWADRHSLHAGRAPLSELYALLDEEGGWVLAPTDDDHVGDD